MVVDPVLARRAEERPASEPVSARSVRRSGAHRPRLARFLEPALALMLLACSWVIPDDWWQLRAAVLGGAYLAGGLRATWTALSALKEHVIDVDLLMVLAALGAAAIGEPVEGAGLLFLFSLSNALQEHALERTRQSVETLMRLHPRTARVVDAAGVEREVPVEAVHPGDRVVIRPGELIPVDGRVTEGRSGVDQATITGESIPVEKGPGDAVFAGTLNQLGVLWVEVTRPASETTLAQIIRLVAEAQERKAETQTRMERLEQRYAWVVLAMTALAIVLPLAWGTPFRESFYRAMVLMVVASPCAVVMSAPPAFLSAIARGARRGFLFKGGAAVERAAEVAVVAFDKTGTLTTGKPRVASLVPVGAGRDDELLGLAAAVERVSEHPLARPVVAAAQERGLEEAAREAEALPGLGVRGRVGEEWVWVGSPRLFQRMHVTLPSELEAERAKLEGRGETVIVVGRSPGADGAGMEVLGLIGVVDQVRSGAAEAVGRLHATGVRTVVMLTGDNRTVAEAVGAQVGVDEIRAELFPEEKQQVIRELKARGPIAMVGDGVNDAPALAAADLGVAMGAAGTDVALETADVILMGDQLSGLVEMRELARHTVRRVRQNLAFAFGVIAVLVILTLAADLPLALGVLGHEGSTVVVALNGLRILGWKGRA